MEPIPDAVVQASRISEYTPRDLDLTRTDDAGRFVLRSSLERKAARLLIHKRGFVPHGESLSEDREVVITLSRGACLTGQVLSLNGEPIPGALLRARRNSVRCTVNVFDADTQIGPLAAEHATATSNAEGRFTLTGLRPNARYVVEALHPSFVMDQHRFDREAAWVRPGSSAPVEIRMARLRVATLGVRAHEVLFTHSAGSQLANGTAIQPPPGFRQSYSDIPTDRILPSCLARLEELQRRHFVLLLREVRRVSGDAGECTVRLGLPGIEPRTFAVGLHGFDEPEWDDVQWLDFSDRLPPHRGTVRVTNRTPLRAEAVKRNPIFCSSERWDPVTGVAVFLLEAHTGRAEWHATLPPGEYIVVRMGDPRRYPVKVRPGAEEPIVTDFRPQHFLRISPRFESGAAAAEVGVYLHRPNAENRNGREWLHGIPEPSGCRQGHPEWLQIPVGYQGPATVMVKKFGYRTWTSLVDLRDADVVLKPVLVPLAGH